MTMAAAALAPMALALWLNAVMLAVSLAMFAVPIVAPRLFGDMGLGASTVGVYAGVLWGCALVASMGAGTVIARFGAWRCLRWAIALCAIGLVAAASGTPMGLLVAAVLIGIGNGAETPAASQLLARGIPAPRRPFLFSVKQTGVQIGGLGGALVLPWLVAETGTRGALLVLSTGVFVLAVLLFYPQVRARDAEAEPARGTSATGSVTLRSALASPWLLRIALAAAAFGATQVCLNSFMVTYAVTERTMSLAEAGGLLAVAQSGGLIGRLLWGWLAAARVRPMTLLRALGAAMALAALALGAAGASLPAAALVPVVFLFGLTASGWNGVLLAETAQAVSLASVAAATGAVMTVMTIGLMLAPPLFAAIGSALSYSAAFVALAVIAAGGVLCLPKGGDA